MLLNGLVKSINAGISVSFDAKKHTFNEYEALLKRLWDGDTTEEEIEFLQSLPPTSRYVKSKYTGELIGGTEKCRFDELEKKGIHLVNSQDAEPRRVRYNFEKKEFEYIDEIEKPKKKTSKKITYELIEERMLNEEDKANGIYDILKKAIDDCKLKNMPPIEALEVLKKTLKSIDME